MKHLVYVSGPPCSGKTTLCDLLMQHTSSFTRMAGDIYWLRNDGQAFEDRVTSTNQMILDDIHSMTDPLLLLEWVPSSGRFVDELKLWCSLHDRVLTHIVMCADVEVLKARKMKRDGDDDISSPDIGQYVHLRDALVIDTSQYSETDMLKRVIETLIVSKALQRS